jgi:UrcA family protein
VLFKVSAPVFCALFICIALDIAPVAHASPESTTVRVDDLNRRSEDGARELLRRIENAASKVCGEGFARRYMSARRAYRQCRDSTVLATVDRLGDEHLSAAYISRYGAF